LSGWRCAVTAETHSPRSHPSIADAASCAFVTNAKDTNVRVVAGAVTLGRVEDTEHHASPDFPQVIQETLDSLPRALRDRISNVEIVVEDEPPRGSGLLGLYQGVPLTKRTHWYSFALPDKISIYRGPIERLSGGDHGRLEAEVRHVVLHELAHHFGISDERLLEIGRY